MKPGNTSTWCNEEREKEREKVNMKANDSFLSEKPFWSNKLRMIVDKDGDHSSDSTKVVKKNKEKLVMPDYKSL